MIDKETHSGKADDLEFGLSSMQGWRVHMEDAHIAETNVYATQDLSSQNGDASGEATKKIPIPHHSFFGVFDGHGGTYAAFYSGNNMCRVLSKQPAFVKYALHCQEKDSKNFADDAEKAAFLEKGKEFLKTALQQAFVECDYEIGLALRGTPHKDANTPYHKPEPTNASGDTAGDTPMQDTLQAAHQAAANHAKALAEDDSGTTACCLLVTPDFLVCANAGDSRAVFAAQAQTTFPLSYDHKPDDEPEETRIRKAGGYVAGGRVEGDLAVSRGLGDFRFKHMPTVLNNTQLTASAENDAGADESEEEKQESSTLMAPGDQKVSPIPDITFLPRVPDEAEFAIVACDGIWDVLSNEEAVKRVASLFEEGESDLGLLCEEVSENWHSRLYKTKGLENEFSNSFCCCCFDRFA